MLKIKITRRDTFGNSITSTILTVPAGETTLHEMQERWIGSGRDYEILAYYPK